MIFVNEYYIDNLVSNETEYYIRRTQSGKAVLAVKAGLLLEAIVYPVSVYPKELSKKMSDFAEAIATQYKSYEHVDDTVQMTINDEEHTEEDPEED